MPLIKPEDRANGVPSVSCLCGGWAESRMVPFFVMKIYRVFI